MSMEKITMPQLGESVTEGTINSWLVKEGDHVNKYDPIADVMTDKVTAEVPSSFTGRIKEIVAKEGETIAVGELMCYIEVEGQETSKERVESPSETKEVVVEDTSMKNRYSPAVLRLSQEHNIDLSLVEGSGRGGRITRKDLEEIIEKGSIPTQATRETEKLDSMTPEVVEQKRPTPAPVESIESASGDIEIPVKGVRKVIADNMVRSKTEVPHAWMTVEVDVTDLVHYRNQIKDDFRATEGYNLTYFAFFVKAVAQALKEFPQINSLWGGDKIIQKKDINLSIAVASGNELFVPVIKNADELSIKGIARSINDLANKARSGSLSTADMQGGTFTVNNTGSFGSIQSMGVINYPQAAILQVESIVKRPVIINDMFAARDMVNLCLSLDHRILDGLICGQFLARIKEILEGMNEHTISVY